GQRLEDLVGRDREAARHAFAQVAALDLHLLHFGAGKGRTDALLDAFGSGLADQHAVIAADVVDDGLVELVAADAHTALPHHAAEADDAHLGGAAADVDHHRARCFAHRLAGAGAERALADRAPLHLGGPARHADDDARARLHHRARMDHLDELLEHLL